MILCNLAVLLAERKTKIAKVSAHTGISRTTLTALYYNTGRGVQFDTANTLCMYFDVGMGDLFTVLPFDLFVEECHIRNTGGVSVEFGCKLQYKRKIECPVLIAHCDRDPRYEDECIIDIPSVQAENSVQENMLLTSIFSQLNNDAQQIVKSRLKAALMEAIQEELETEIDPESCKWEFGFPDKFVDK